MMLLELARGKGWPKPCLKLEPKCWRTCCASISLLVVMWLIRWAWCPYLCIKSSIFFCIWQINKMCSCSTQDRLLLLLDSWWLLGIGWLKPKLQKYIFHWLVQTQVTCIDNLGTDLNLRPLTQALSPHACRLKFAWKNSWGHHSDWASSKDVPAPWDSVVPWEEKASLNWSKWNYFWAAKDWVILVLHKLLRATLLLLAASVPRSFCCFWGHQGSG